MAVGDKLLLSPSGKAVRVRGLHAQNQQAEAGHAGQRLALNLAGVEKSDIARGDWIVAEPAHAPTQRLDARVRVLASESQGRSRTGRRCTCTSARRTSARAWCCSKARPIAPGASAWVQLELDRPIGALHGDRFILRDQSALRTLGGGAVIDAFAPATRRRKHERLAVLAALDKPAPAEALAALLALGAAQRRRPDALHHAVQSAARRREQR